MPEDRNRPSMQLRRVEAEGEGDDFLHREARPLDIGGPAIDAVDAVIDTAIGEQDFQQGNAAAVRRIGVANPHALGTADSGCLAVRTAFFGAGTGAGRIVFRGIRKDFEFAEQVHVSSYVHCQAERQEGGRGGHRARRGRFGSRLLENHIVGAPSACAANLPSGIELVLLACLALQHSAHWVSGLRRCARPPKDGDIAKVVGLVARRGRSCERR